MRLDQTAQAAVDGDISGDYSSLTAGFSCAILLCPKDNVRSDFWVQVAVGSKCDLRKEGLLTLTLLLSGANFRPRKSASLIHPPLFELLRII